MTKFVIGLAGVCGLFIDATAAMIPIELQSPYHQDFDYPNLAFAPAGGRSDRLPPGWEIEDRADERYRIGNGRRRRGDIYSFGTTGAQERALGSLRQGRETLAFGAAFLNTSGHTITQLSISYWGEEWRLGAATGPRDRLDFQYSLDANSLTRGTWTDVNALDFDTPNNSGRPGRRDGNDSRNRTLITASFPVDIPEGQSFWVRWRDWNAPGWDDGLAVDQFSLVAVPEASTWCRAAACLFLLLRLGLRWRKARDGA